jgi:hypothetical protein
MSEGFSPAKQEKIDKIHNWWSDNSRSPSYKSYKEDMKSNGIATDVVEYDAIKQKINGGGSVKVTDVERVVVA